jgi:hypothetical protein
MSKRRRLRFQHRRRYRTLVCWMLGLLLCALGTAFWVHSAAQDAAPSSTTQSNGNQQTPVPLAELRVGMFAPDLTLPIAQGGFYHLAVQRGHIVLLSFLVTQLDTLASASRSQAVALLSMQHQYGPKGVEVVLVDESGDGTGQGSPPLSTLLNVTYDWDLGSIPLLSDGASHTTARAYGIQQIPTTFLLGASGQVVNRWNGRALAAQLGQALQNLVGSPTTEIDHFENNACMEMCSSAKNRKGGKQRASEFAMDRVSKLDEHIL